MGETPVGRAQVRRDAAEGTTSKQRFWFHQDVLLLRNWCSYLTEGQRGKTESEIVAFSLIFLCQDVGKSSSYSVGGALLLEAAELELELVLVLVLGSSAIPPPSRNMVTAISRLLLHASNMCFPTLSVAPRSEGQGHKTHLNQFPHLMLPSPPCLIIKSVAIAKKSVPFKESKC